MPAARPDLKRLLPELYASADRIWAKLANAPSRSKTRNFVFTAAEPGVGTTMMAAATAMNVALHLRGNVLLVETNLAQPRLAAYLGCDAQPGLAEMLDGAAGAQTCMRFIDGFPGLRVVTAGGGRDTIPGEFASERGRSLLGVLKGSSDCVLFDAPPVMSHPETRILIEESDGVILVVRARSSRKRAVRKVADVCESLGVPVLGTVLNRFKTDLPFGIGKRGI